MNDEISIINKRDFPETLRNAPGSPRLLYIRGRLSDNRNQRYLCVIGSRQATQYGIDCVNKIMEGLRGYPISIVSGLAVGIDGMAHQAALDNGLHCVCFPGSTLERGSIYPYSNSHIAEEIILKGGAILSKWGPGYDTGKWAFPYRNKLMASISHAVLIIEAGKRSGALMTAQYAADMGRDVFAVPGSIFSGNSYGTAMLIGSGAKIITSAKDILDEFGFGSIDETSLPLPPIPDLDPESSKILELVQKGQISVDSLIEKLQIQAKIFNEKISILEMDGLISVDGELVSRKR